MVEKDDELLEGQIRDDDSLLDLDLDDLSTEDINTELIGEEGDEDIIELVDLVKEGLEELNFDKGKEKVLLCRGNIFDNVRAYFIEEGILYEDAIIEGKLQDAVEHRLVKHLRTDLGIRSKKLTTKSGAKRYFVLFNWVSYDFYKREKYVKSGFKKLCISLHVPASSLERN